MNAAGLEQKKGYAIAKSPWQRIADEAGMRIASHVGSVLARTLPRPAGTKFGGLMYHRVSEVIAGVTAPTMNVSPQRLTTQLLGLKRSGIQFWPLAKVLEYRAASKTLPQDVSVVTFDDGFSNFYHHAWPILRELDIPATLFVATSFLDSKEPFPFDHWAIENQQKLPELAYVPLSMEQCREMYDQGLSIGAHSHTHLDFRGRAEDFKLDLQQSIEIIRTEFPSQKMLFAFPFGTPSMGFAAPDLVAAARACGADCGLTTGSQLNSLDSDPFTWGRFNAFPWDTEGTLLAKLRGWYSWAPRLMSKIRRHGKKNVSLTGE